MDLYEIVNKLSCLVITNNFILPFMLIMIENGVPQAYKVPGDGDCLYHAILMFLKGIFSCGNITHSQ